MEIRDRSSITGRGGGYIIVGGKSRFDPTKKGTMEEVLAMLKWRLGAEFFSR